MGTFLDQLHVYIPDAKAQYQPLLQAIDTPAQTAPHAMKSC
jgi:hypothetical protein